MDVGGQRFQQRRHAGEKVVHRRRRNLCALGHAVDRQTGHAFGRQQRAGGVEDRVDPGLAAGAGFARGGGAGGHGSLLQGSGHCMSRSRCCLPGRHREQAPSHTRTGFFRKTRSNVGGSLLPMAANSVYQKQPIKKRHRPKACDVFSVQPALTRYAGTSCTQGRRWSVRTLPAHFPYRRRRYRCI